MTDVIPESTEEKVPRLPKTMSIKTMFERISDDVSATPNESQNPAVTVAAVDLQLLHANDMLDQEAVKKELSNLASTEDQLEAMRSLQSLIGRSELRIALFPVLEDFLAEKSPRMNSRMETTDPSVISAVERLHILHMSDSVRRVNIEEELQNLPRRSQKRALLFELKNEIGEKELLKAIQS